MKTYETIIDLLNFEGPGLQDYVTAEELDQLIDGTLAPVVIAYRYIEDLADSPLVAVETGQDTTRRDLITWIRWEIDGAVEQRKQIARDEAMCAKLAEIETLVAAEKQAADQFRQDKLILARQAFDRGATKGAVADALGVSRPTLDAWLKQAE